MGWLDKISANTGLIRRTEPLNSQRASVGGEYSVKNTFNFGNANPNRPESRPMFSQSELCGDPVKGLNAYYLA